MLATMQDVPLTTARILRHGQQVYPDSVVITCTEPGSRRASFPEVAARAERLAAGLARLGVGQQDRVGTFCWNHQEHLEAYLAVPSMGAVLHTLNIRLFPDQAAHVVTRGGAKIVLVDVSLAPLWSRIAERLHGVELVVAVGEGDRGGLDTGAATVVAYEEVIGAEKPGYAWPDLDERAPATMCHTSGTTGDPKGVVYSHRSTVLHAMSITSSAVLGLAERDRILVIVPMFHVNAWGTPYGAWMVGADMVMPQHLLQAGHLSRIIAAERPTISCGVPTIWNDLLHYSEDHPVDLSSVDRITAGGSAVPRSLMEAFERSFGVSIIQGWGMTETSPVCTLAVPPANCPPEEIMDYRVTAGRVVPGVDIRVAAEDGTILPRDGKSPGEVEVRGPWITGSYYEDPAPERFHDGWLRTGDVGTIDGRGYLRLSDRKKDMIKSGGEWISSSELETALMAHPAVREAAVIGVPDDRWQERPLAIVLRRQGDTTEAPELAKSLLASVARWWVPERWAFVEEIPKTSVGKFDKRTLRDLHAKGRLDVSVIERP